MTLAEAEADVKWWRVYADTVGGDAVIVCDPAKIAFIIKRAGHESNL